MDKFEILKAEATRQFRHNDDNSPDMFKPVSGFVIAYDKEVIDKGLKELRAKLEAAESRDVVTPEYFQSWVDRAYEAEATIKALTDGIQGYLDGDEPEYKPKWDCEHGTPHYKDCGQCIEEYFASLLKGAR